LSAIDDIRKVLQDFLAPELRTINERINNTNDRIKSLEQKMDLRFDVIEEKFKTLIAMLEVSARIDKLERERDEKKVGTN
jgi:flagellar capping protein FliD